LVPPKGESLFIFSLTDRFGNQTSDTVAVSNHDLIAAASPAHYGAQFTESEMAEAGSAQPVETAEAEQKPASGDTPALDEPVSNEDGDGRCSPLWWLLLLLAVIVLYLIRRSRKRKTNENV
jgi:hypothetical protein